MPFEECRGHAQQFIDANLPVLVRKVCHSNRNACFFGVCIASLVRCPASLTVLLLLWNYLDALYTLKIGHFVLYPCHFRLASAIKLFAFQYWFCHINGASSLDISVGFLHVMSKMQMPMKDTGQTLR